ncbi:MAG: hypothetical protein ACXAEN_19195 [Candidatus Thorarchaeota archaeon]|jgi:hypothetical protein
MLKDPYREKKDEFLHKLHEMHKGHPVGNLDLGELAAGKMLLTEAMKREGVVLNIGESADLLGEMAHAVGGDTKAGGLQFAAQLEARKRNKSIGKYQERKMEEAREMLMRKNRGK